MKETRESCIVQINKDIIESYNKIGGINHIDGPNLPSRRGVLAIIDTFESLIFPGFQAEEKLEDDLISYTIGTKTQQLMRELTIEISRSLEYAARMKDYSIQIGGCREKAEDIAQDMLIAIPKLRSLAMGDVQATFNGDPAAVSHEEIILSYPGIEAITCHRIAHELFLKEIPLIPRMMSEHIHGKAGIDIHPGAAIGENFFLDHATGVVIGETAIIGKNVKIYQGVTIGALSVAKKFADKKRHPTIEDNVTIYAGTTILGGKTVIGKGSVIGGNLWLTESVSPYSIIYNKPTEYRTKNRYNDNSPHNWII